MKKMMRNIIILGAVIIIGIVAAIIVPKIIADYKAPKVDEEKVANTQVIDRDEGDVTKIEVQNSDDKFTLVLDSSGSWRLEGKDSIQLNADVISELVHNVTVLYGDSLVYRGTDRMSEFGLDQPRAIITATYKDGTQAIFNLGNDTPDGRTAYLNREGDDKVVNVYNAVTESYMMISDQFQMLEVITMDPTLITGLKMEYADKPTIELKILEDDTYLGLTPWHIVSPWLHSSSGKGKESLFTALGSIEFIDIIEVNPKDRAKYGLDKPRMTVTVEAEQGLGYKMYIGDDLGFSTYVMLDGSKAVYEVENSYLTVITGITAMNLTDPALSLVTIMQVKEFTFTGPSQSATFKVNHVPVKDDSGNVRKDSNGKDMLEEQYFYNDKELPQESMQEWYKNILYITIQDRLPEGYTVSGSPSYTIHYSLDNEKFPERTMSFYSYDLDYYAATVDGVTIFKVPKDNLKKVAEIMKLILEGKYNPE